jgi:hypothetical protein
MWTGRKQVEDLEVRELQADYNILKKYTECGGIHRETKV